jgi:hypothetical protein
MAFALDVMVMVRIMKCLRADPHDAVVEHVENIDAGKVPAGVP